MWGFPRWRKCSQAISWHSNHTKDYRFAFQAVPRTSRLVGKAYTAAGHAGGELHIPAVLQAYQADLLKALDKDKARVWLQELRHTTNLALRATKQAAHSICHSLWAMVAMEWHLWLNFLVLQFPERDLERTEGTTNPTQGTQYY